MMKRLTVWVAAALFFVMLHGQTVKAQVLDGPEPQTSLVGVRLGLGTIVGANVTYDYALARVWKGTFTIGAQIGYMYDFWGSGTSSSGSIGGSIGLGMHSASGIIRTTYRFNVLVPAWEVYGGIGLGGGAWFATMAGYYDVAAVFAGTAILGTTYYFTPNIGANFEMCLGSTAGGDRQGWNARSQCGLWNWINLGIVLKL